MATRTTTLSRRFLALTLFATLAASAPAFGATAYRIEASQGTFAATPGPTVFGLRGSLTARLLPTVGGPGQEWFTSVYNASAHGYRIRNRSQGGCMAMDSTSATAQRADGSAVILRGCPITGDQSDATWRFYVGWPRRLVGPDSPYVATNLVTIMNVLSRKCIGIAPTAQFVSGVLLRQYPCSPASRMRWRLRAVTIP
jgi:hypothetical protein